MNKRVLLILLLIFFPVMMWSEQSSVTDKECWQLLDQASERLAQLSKLLQDYRNASEKQDAVLKQAVEQAVDEATTPLLIRIADQDDRIGRLKQNTRLWIILSGAIGVACGVVIGLVAGAH